MAIDLDVLPTEEDLADITKRIAPGWGRSIRCNRGWYSLLIELDKELAALMPDYVVHQVKEKFGSLCYYYTGPKFIVPCCAEEEANDPRPVYRTGSYYDPDVAEYLKEGQVLLGEWITRRVMHTETQEHISIYADALEKDEAAYPTSLYTAMDAVVTKYQEIASRTCELTGTPGVLMVKNGWFATLNPKVAPEGFVFSQND